MKKYQTRHILFLLLPLVTCVCHANPTLPGLLKNQLTLKNSQKPSRPTIYHMRNPQDQRACIEFTLGKSTTVFTLTEENNQLTAQYHQIDDPYTMIQAEPKTTKDIQDIYRYIDNVEQQIFKRHYLNYDHIIFLHGSLRRLQVEVEIGNKHTSDSKLDVFSDMNHIKDIKLIDVSPSDNKKIFFESHLAWGEAEMDLQAGWQWPSNGEMLDYRFEYLNLQATLKFGARSKLPQIKWECLQQDSKDNEFRLGFYRDLTQKELLMFTQALSEYIKLVHEGLFSPSQLYLLQRR